MFIEFGALFVLLGAFLVGGGITGAWLCWRVARGILEAANSSRVRVWKEDSR